MILKTFNMGDLAMRSIKNSFILTVLTMSLSCTANNPFTYYKLASCYHHGIGSEKNIDRAFEYYLKAAEQGHRESQFYVGYFYECGLGIEQNFKKAAEWYQKAVESNDTAAMYNLAIFYANGKGVEK